MSRPQWLALAALGLICLLGGACSPQSDEFLHPWRLVTTLTPSAAM